MKIATGCSDVNCGGELELISYEILLQLRKKRTNSCIAEIPSLRCSKCRKTCSAMSGIDAVLEHGYQRCFSRSRLNDEEVKQLIWTGLPMKPNSNDTMELDRRLLNLSSIHVLVNMHDWKHRTSCFKSSSESCRYKIPQIPILKTNAKPIFSKNEADSNGKGSMIVKVKLLKAIMMQENNFPSKMVILEVKLLVTATAKLTVGQNIPQKDFRILNSFQKTVTSMIKNVITNRKYAQGILIMFHPFRTLKGK